MQSWEIILFVLLGLLVLAGVIVTIYFVLRHDNNKNKTPTGGGGGGSGGGVGGLTGLTGATGTNGPTGPPKNQTFSLTSAIKNPLYKVSVSDSLGSTRSVFAYNVIGPCDSYAWQYKDVTRNNTTISNALEFQYTSPGKGILFPTNDTISVTVSGQTQTAKKLGIDNNDITTQPASWIFKDSKICLQNSPNLCLFVEDSDVSGLFATMVLADSTNSTDAGFSWIVGPLPTPANGCSTT